MHAAAMKTSDELLSSTASEWLLPSLAPLLSPGCLRMAQCARLRLNSSNVGLLLDFRLEMADNPANPE